LVLATRNPIESEGAYQLPEAQLDRFMIKAIATYNTPQEELKIAKMQMSNSDDIMQVMSYADIQEIKKEIENIHIDKEIEEYMIDLIFATRNPQDYGMSDLVKYIEFGVSPRASIDLFKVVRAKAYMDHKDFVSPVDIARVIKDVLRHRIVLSYEAQADEISADDIIDRVISTVDIP
jgi:MoxR-like ATPase